MRKESEHLWRICNDVCQCRNRISEAIDQLQQLLEKLPFTQNVDLSAIGTAIQDFLTNFVSSSDSATLGAIGEFAKSLPDMIVGIVVGLLAAYFFIADKDKLITGWRNIYLPDSLQKQNVSINSLCMR